MHVSAFLHVHSCLHFTEEESGTPRAVSWGRLVRAWAMLLLGFTPKHPVVLLPSLGAQEWSGSSVVLGMWQDGS